MLNQIELFQHGNSDSISHSERQKQYLLPIYHEIRPNLTGDTGDKMIWLYRNLFETTNFGMNTF